MRHLLALTILSLTININGTAQKSTWKSIDMIDTIAGYTYALDKVASYKYGPGNIFDNNLKTCWIAGNSVIYLRVPQYNRVLNIFNGYGKSPALYRQNDRVKKLKISFYLGVQPEGHVSEIATEYYLYDPHITQVVEFEDVMGIRHINLLDSMFEDQLILIAAFDNFARDIGYEVNEVQPIIKIEIINTFPGTKYRDICISELFFSDKYILYNPETNKTVIDTLYINEEENSLIAQLNTGKKQVLYANKDEDIWLSEISNDKEWVIIMTMEAESRGKGLSSFKLINTKANKVVNDDLQKSLGKSIEAMYFEYRDSVLFVLCIETPIPEEHLVKLAYHQY